MLDRRSFLLCSLGAGLPLTLYSWSASAQTSTRGALAPLARRPGVKPRNIMFVLTDDHRYDAMGFLSKRGYPQTPALDRLARDGVHFRNAFVTTALCSPSRASILTGLYAHQHRVVDNNHPIDPALIFFPQYLQQAGYETAFIGKWHMGGDVAGELENDSPQRGFDHWVSFPGQGTYLPSESGLNVNGMRVPQKGYITDELTDYALQWLGKRSVERPFYLCLSHKAVHADFIPAARHQGRYAKERFERPATWDSAPGKEALRPMWVQNQRNSWHGVDFPYHSTLDIGEYYKRYCETLLAVDESIIALLEHLRRRGLLESTLVLYMGDNGFAFGEHGLIDKRTAYEESMRVPMLMHCPELFKAGRVVEEVVANIDIAPSLLEAAGLTAPGHIAGRSVLPLALDAKNQPSWSKDIARRRPQLLAARARRPGAVARVAPVRVLLGAKFSADTHCARAARAALQVHPLSRHLGYRRALRSAGRSAGSEQPDLRAGPRSDRATDEP